MAPLLIQTISIGRFGGLRPPRKTYFMLGLMQLRHSASQCHVFACGSMVLADLLVYGFSALRAEKPYTFEKERTALPKAQCANCVSPITYKRRKVPCRRRL